MNWDSVQLGAKTKGNLIYATDQGQTAAMTEPGPWGNAYSGYCRGMAVRWISLCYQGSDFPYDRTTKEYSDTDWRSTMAQNVYEDAVGADLAEGWSNSVAPYAMVISKGLRMSRKAKPTGAAINLIVTQAYGCYGISLRRDGGGHSIAARHGRDGRFHLFDANYGHFAARGPDAFKTFLDWYFDKTGYGDRYQKETFVCGVKPPIAQGGPQGV